MSETRKKDHIDLTFKSRPKYKLDLGNLFYEPILAAHPKDDTSLALEFMGHEYSTPLWVSSMTGGTGIAKKINQNLAMACGEFGFGMGLGSCRSLLSKEGYTKNFSDFDVKKFMGNSPLFTNFGVAQIEELNQKNSLDLLFEMTHKLNADGMIIHVNPLQEWAQPEGDKYRVPAFETIKAVLEIAKIPIVVKEVGQGFGPKSLELLCSLPLAAIELAGFGGTNFTNIEQTRLFGQKSGTNGPINNFGQIGHTIEEMLGFLSKIESKNLVCKNFILSGGVTDPLMGFKHLSDCPYPAVIGMASEFLKHAMGEYLELRDFVLALNDQLAMAKNFLRRV